MVTEPIAVLLPIPFYAGRMSFQLDPKSLVKPFDLLQPWPLSDGCAQNLTCFHVLEYLNSQQRMTFMNECGRVLSVGQSMRVTFYYVTSRQASQDPLYHWPPLSEFSFYYYNAAWRKANGCIGYPITCDFDFTYKLDLEGSVSVRSEEFQRFATKHYNQSIIKMFGLMTKRS